MQVSIETTTGLERRMTVGVPAEKVDREVESRLQKATQTVRLAGFRPGKVPLKVVRRRFGAGVRAEVIGEVMSQSLQEAIVEQQLQPAGQPTVEAKQTASGRDLEFVATFEIYPDITLADLSGLKIERPEAEVTDADVDRTIDTLRRQQGSWRDVERAAALDDQVTIDFDGTIEGEAFEGGEGRDVELVLGSGRMISGFEEGIVGMQAGEEKTLELQFPEHYHAEELRGRPVRFAVSLQRVAEPEPAALDDEFFARHGIEDGGEQAFRDAVRMNMQREMKQAISNRVKQQLTEQLLGLHDVALPEALVKGEIGALRRQAFQQFGQMPDNVDESILPDELFRERAERRVALGLLFGELIRARDIKVDPARVRETIEDAASTYRQPEAVVQHYYGDRQLLASVESAVLEDQVVDSVLDGITVSTVAMSYDEALQSVQSADQPATT